MKKCFDIQFFTNIFSFDTDFPLDVIDDCFAINTTLIHYEYDYVNTIGGGACESRVGWYCHLNKVCKTLGAGT